MFYSPLRYPGGKNKLSKFIAGLCDNNVIHGHYVEPYAGGASVGLNLLLENKVSRITINDIDRSIYSFWFSVLNRTNELCNLIEDTEVTIENWINAKAVQKYKQKANLLELGFSTFFLNRTNISGIINAGVIGGINQEGKYKIDCRFNKLSLIKRIKKIAIHKKHIKIHNMDAVNIIRSIQNKEDNSQTIYYFDPPYYIKGQSLYVNYYTPTDHRDLAIEIKNIKYSKWIVSYDDVPQIKNYYAWVKTRIQYSLPHSAYHAKEGKEVLFFSNNLNVNKKVNPIKII